MMLIGNLIEIMYPVSVSGRSTVHRVFAKSVEKSIAAWATFSFTYWVC